MRKRKLRDIYERMFILQDLRRKKAMYWNFFASHRCHIIKFLEGDRHGKTSEKQKQWSA